ncbi:MAG: hypothetical protein CO170_02020 [candidate division SR1 bacterium CG_4_9_14_3_um_filter_40_9]|nr:MAG: hypothetical protein CO170_02020 [candidate division SR1 bacterium CG_4_9_14_3_um_filter_40_9]
MRLFRVGRMIDRILIAGILVGAALLLLFWKADDRFLNKVRQGVGIIGTGIEGRVTSTGISITGQNSKF